MPKSKVSILLPNYKTPELTELCLRLLRRFTPPNDLQIIAIDNASNDASSEFLRAQRDIRLLERSADAIANLAPAAMHATALDLALDQVDTPYVLSIHTDTLVTRPDWLEFLVRKLEANERIAGVGSWKLECQSWLKIHAQHLENLLRNALKGRKPEKQEHFLRSHCALFRTELVRKHTQGFDENECACKAMCRRLKEAGYELELMPSWELMPYMRHLNHATMVLNPELGGRKTTKPAARRKLEKELAMLRHMAEKN